MINETVKVYAIITVTNKLYRVLKIYLPMRI